MKSGPRPERPVGEDAHLRSHEGQFGGPASQFTHLGSVFLAGIAVEACEGEKR